MAAIEPIIYSAIEVSKVLRTRPEIYTNGLSVEKSRDTGKVETGRFQRIF
ncbi:MAG: hypothetical protein ACLRYB_18355 [Segatella copri]